MAAAHRKSWPHYIGLACLLFAVICGYFYLIQTPSLFPARTIPVSLTYDFDLPHQEIFIETPDGATLNGVLFAAEQPKGVILHFHGNAENMLSMEHTARPFVQMGYDFLAWDYRSYGKSTGALSEQGLFEDAGLVMQHLEEKGWRQQDIILYGRSIGTGLAIELASRTKPGGVILYSPFYNMHSLVSEKFPFLPVGMILKYPLTSDEYLQSVDAPLLILHGDEDSLIPIEHAKCLAQTRGRLVIIEGGGHNNLTSFPVFWREVTQFLASLENEH